LTAVTGTVAFLYSICVGGQVMRGFEIAYSEASQFFVLKNHPEVTYDMPSVT